MDVLLQNTCNGCFLLKISLTDIFTERMVWGVGTPILKFQKKRLFSS